MKVRLLADRVGARFVQRQGQVIDLPRDEAQQLVKANSAEPVRGADVETTSVSPPRNAMQGRGRPR